MADDVARQTLTAQHRGGERAFREEILEGQQQDWPGVTAWARESCYTLCASPSFLTLPTPAGITPSTLARWSARLRAGKPTSRRWSTRLPMRFWSVAMRFACSE